MNMLEQQKDLAQGDSDKILQQIRKKELEIQARCPHETVRYYTDIYEPSVYSCTACGKNVIPTPKTKILK